MAFKVGFKELDINWGTWFDGRKKVIDVCDHLTLKTCQGVFYYTCISLKGSELR